MSARKAPKRFKFEVGEKEGIMPDALGGDRDAKLRADIDKWMEKNLEWVPHPVFGHYVGVVSREEAFFEFAKIIQCPPGVSYYVD